MSQNTTHVDPVMEARAREVSVVIFGADEGEYDKWPEHGKDEPWLTKGEARRVASWITSKINAVAERAQGELREIERSVHTLSPQEVVNHCRNGLGEPYREWTGEVPPQVSPYDNKLRIENLEDSVIRLKSRLMDAVAVIRSWHGMGMLDHEVERRAWEIYWAQSPEMRPLREAIEAFGTKATSREAFMADVAHELARAYAKHGRAPWGRHLFSSILREEFEELWDTVKKDAPDADFYSEMVQVAAMCFRHAETRAVSGSDGRPA